MKSTNNKGAAMTKTLDEQLNDIDAELFQLRTAAHAAARSTQTRFYGSLSARIESLEREQDALRNLDRSAS